MLDSRDTKMNKHSLYFFGSWSARGEKYDISNNSAVTREGIVPNAVRDDRMGWGGGCD